MSKSGISQQQQHQYEHLLFGSVTEGELSSLLHRLRGLCDCTTAGGLPFADREIGFKIEAGNAVTRMKVRQSLDNPEAPWHLIYTGQIELGVSPAAVRTCIITACSQNLIECLNELGFTITTELILKGYLFRKDQIKISVFKMFTPGDNGELEGAQPVFDRHLVELSAITPTGQDAIGSKMRSFADQLKPFAISNAESYKLRRQMEQGDHEE